MVPDFELWNYGLLRGGTKEIVLSLLKSLKGFSVKITRESP